MKRTSNFQGILLWYTMFAALLLLVLSSLGCASVEPEVRVERVEVPVAVAPEPIDFRPPPAWFVPELDPKAPMTEKLRAIVADLGACHDYVDYLTYLLEVFNAAAAEFSSGLGDLTSESDTAAGGSPN